MGLSISTFISASYLLVLLLLGVTHFELLYLLGHLPFLSLYNDFLYPGDFPFSEVYFILIHLGNLDIIAEIIMGIKESVCLYFNFANKICFGFIPFLVIHINQYTKRMSGPV